MSQWQIALELRRSRRQGAAAAAAADGIGKGCFVQEKLDSSALELAPKLQQQLLGGAYSFSLLRHAALGTHVMAAAKDLGFRV